MRKSTGTRARVRVRLAGAVAALLVVAPAAAGCATRTDASTVLLEYNGGPGANKTFDQCVRPASSAGVIVNNTTYALPTTLRTWHISADGGGDSDTPLVEGSKPGPDGQAGPQVKVYTNANFYINTDCGKNNKDPNSPLVQFWQRLGSSAGYNISSDGDNGFSVDNWRKLLLNTLVAAERKVLSQGTRQYLADDLVANTNDVRGQLEKSLAPAFQAELLAALGGNFFCGAEYAGGRPVSWTEPQVHADGTIGQVGKRGACPPVRISITDVDYADQGIADSRANVYKAQQQAQANLIAAQNQKAVADTLASASKDSNYVQLKTLQNQLDIAEKQLEAAQACARNPRCTVVVGVPGVNVNAGR